MRCPGKEIRCENKQSRGESAWKDRKRRARQEKHQESVVSETGRENTFHGGISEPPCRSCIQTCGFPLCPQAHGEQLPPGPLCTGVAVCLVLAEEIISKKDVCWFWAQFTLAYVKFTRALLLPGQQAKFKKEAALWVEVPKHLRWAESPANPHWTGRVSKTETWVMWSLRFWSFYCSII